MKRKQRKGRIKGAILTFATILLLDNNWIEYQKKYSETIRIIEIENVEKMLKCGTPGNGYQTYICSNCETKKYITFTCKSRVCTSCGTKMVNEWVDKIHSRMINVMHRHIVLTLPDEIGRIMDRNYKLQKVMLDSCESNNE